MLFLPALPHISSISPCTFSFLGIVSSSTSGFVGAQTVGDRVVMRVVEDGCGRDLKLGVCVGRGGLNSSQENLAINLSSSHHTEGAGDCAGRR